MLGLGLGLGVLVVRVLGLDRVGRRGVVALTGLGVRVLGLVGDHGLLGGGSRLGHGIQRGDGGRTTEGGEHVAHVAQLGGDAVAARRGRAQLPLGVTTDPLGLLLGSRDDRCRLGPGRLEQPGGLLRLRGAVLLGLAGQQVGTLLHRGQGLVLLGHLTREVGRRPLATLGQGALEVGGRLGGRGALLLVVRLCLLAAGSRLAGRVVDDGVGLLLGAGESLGGVDVGA